MGTFGIPAHAPLEDHPFSARREPSALKSWILEVLYCDPKRSRAYPRMLSTPGQGVYLCWAHSTPEGPTKKGGSQSAQVAGRDFTMRPGTSAFSKELGVQPDGPHTLDRAEQIFMNTHICTCSARPYKVYSKLRTHAALGSYGRTIARGIGPPEEVQGRCVSLSTSNPCSFRRKTIGQPPWNREIHVQGYPAHKKQRPPTTLQ